jgi:hypothetical protein
VAVRDACAALGHAWLTRRDREGSQTLVLRLEPVWQSLTGPDVLAALATHDIEPIAARRGRVLSVVHRPSQIAMEIEVAAKLSAAARKELEATLGKGWRKLAPR